MASTYKHCNCPGCFETIVGDSEGVDLCDDCESADCDPFGDVEAGACNAREQAEDEPPACPKCDGPGTVLGVLGAVTHYRCRNCGVDYNNFGDHE